MWVTLFKSYKNSDNSFFSHIWNLILDNEATLLRTVFHGASVSALCQCSLAVVLPCYICTEFWREGQQGQSGGFGWEWESVQNGSCRRTSEGRQQHKQVRHCHRQVAKLNFVRMTVFPWLSLLVCLPQVSSDDGPHQKQFNMALSAAVCWTPCVSSHRRRDPDSYLTQMRATRILSGKSDSSAF